MNKISLSICVPAYNAGRFLKSLVESIRHQAFQDWELIIIDNASTDESASVLRAIQSEVQENRLRIFTNTETVSMAENWNIAINHAKGEFLKLICADDLPLPDIFERQVSALRSYPQASLASGARIIINGAGKRLFTRSGISRTGLYQGREMVRRCIMSGTNIIGDPVNVMWRRTAMEKVGYFDPTVVYCTDIEYWLRLLSVGDLYYDTDPTGFYRIHSGAAATGLAGVTVKDFIHTARLQEKLGTVSLSEYDLKIIALKSHLQSKLRQYFYRFLG